MRRILYFKCHLTRLHYQQAVTAAAISDWARGSSWLMFQSGSFGQNCFIKMKLFYAEIITRNLYRRLALDLEWAIRIQLRCFNGWRISTSCSHRFTWWMPSHSLSSLITTGVPPDNRDVIWIYMSLYWAAQQTDTFIQDPDARQMTRSATWKSFN